MSCLPSSVAADLSHWGKCVEIQVVTSWGRGGSQVWMLSHSWLFPSSLGKTRALCKTGFCSSMLSTFVLVKTTQRSLGYWTKRSWMGFTQFFKKVTKLNSSLQCRMSAYVRDMLTANLQHHLMWLTCEGSNILGSYHQRTMKIAQGCFSSDLEPLCWISKLTLR